MVSSAKVRWFRALLVALLTIAGVTSFGDVVRADPGDIGNEGPTFLTVSGSHPSGEKPQSKLWYHDGTWWGSIWSDAAGSFNVHQLDPITEQWTDTGVVLETAGIYRQDTLFDGTKLYVASQRYATSVGTAEARLVRLSYDDSTDQWSVDAGFPVAISNDRSETLTIDKDSTGRLWATWNRGASVWVNHTVCSPGCDDATWATPFELSSIPAIGTTASTDADDISSVVAFGGRIGVFWSNQRLDAFYFAIHQDGDPVSTWSNETAWSGPNEADDHINIATDGSNVFVTVKTSLDSSGQPETYVLKRTAAGAWSAAVTSTGSERLTRPIVTYDQLNDELHWFAADVAGGAVYTKTSPAAAPSFVGGKGEAVMYDASADDMNDPTSTKQAVDPSTGLVALATDNVSKTYWHHRDTLGGTAAITAGFTGSPLSGEAPVTVQFTDTSIGSVTDWSWDFGDTSTSTEQNPAHTYTTPGVYTVSLTVTGPDGSDIEVKSDYVTVIAPQPLAAAFSNDPTEGAAPMTVQFTDESTGTPTSWSWDFGDGSTSTEQHPTHVYNAIGSYDVSLTVTNADGDTDTTTTFDAVVVTDQIVVEPAADAYLRLDRPTNNYGADTFLRVRDATSGYESLVKFDVQGVGSAPVTATLRLFVTDGSPHAGDLYLVGNDWTELGVTPANAPATSGPPAALGGEAVLGTWHEWDVTSLIAGDGEYSFRLVSNDGNSAFFSSREGANPPQLVITTASTAPLGAAFSADPLTPEVGETVTFTDGSTGAPTTWLWEFGDGATSTEQHPQHAYTAPGPYTVTLTVGDGTTTDTRSVTDYIVVSPPLPLDASFSVDSPTGIAPHTVNFTDTSTGVPTSWSWNFGDGTPPSTEQHPQHTYVAPGTYTVTLTVGDGTTTDSEILAAAVTVTNETTYVATADSFVRSDRVDGNYGSEDYLRIRASSRDYRSLVQFDVTSMPTTLDSAVLRLFVTDASPHAGDLHLVANTWTESGVTWNDQPAIGIDPIALGGPAVAGAWHEWDVTSALAGAAAGPVSFTIVSTSGNSTFFSSREGANPPQLVISGVSGPPPLVAEFSGSPLAIEAGQSVSFTDLSAGSPTSWSWDFGDGGTSTEQNPSHTYTAAGTYTVSLTVGDAAGGSDTMTKAAYVSVSEPPPLTAEFSGSPLAIEAGQSVSFTDLSSGPAAVTSWSWDFGDGGTSTEQNPSHTYTAAGTYTVSLIVGDGAGFDDVSKVAYVSVSEPPPLTAEFSGTPLAGSTPLLVQFTDLSTGSPTSWSWDFGDGGTSTEQNPSHTYTAAGTYTVSLTVGDTVGGSDTMTKTGYLVVSDPPSGPSTFEATEDAYVKIERPDNNYGTDTWLRVRRSSTSYYDSLLKFDVSGLTAAPSQAVLRLYVTDDSDSAGAVSTVDPGAWSESTVTWNTSPAPLSPVAADQATPAVGQWVEWDVTSAVTGNGLVSFVLSSTSGNSAFYSSREGANPPQLVVTP